jgi:DNA gyrase subunit A
MDTPIPDDPTHGGVARTLINIDIEQEMRSSYLDYSMSVIIGRALPDVRDGLKPVHRRILYAMYREGHLASRRYSKCAGVVGEVLKKYHPHGDSAVYDALVRLAQPWNMRYPLVDGQGNFGSVDGDPAAAYRYTECRMTRLAEELLNEIDQDTVDFAPNFDGATEEPVVMPAAFPNLLVNGSDGIAVGMATKIPPHNIGEIIDAVIALSHNPEITVSELMRIVPGPDFPTAGTIYGRTGVREAYETGRGRVVVRGATHYEETDSSRDVIVIDELPYQTNKARLLEEIAGLVKEKRIEGISALRDESDRQGMRVVVELKRDATKEVILNQLFKHTQLQGTFGVILLAIVNNRPEVLTLKEMLSHYLQHRRDVTVRRLRYELRKAKDRLHILEGLLRALDHLDEVIRLIRASATPEEAREGLVSTFDFSVIQAQAILDMRLQRLTGLERDKIQEEFNGLLARVTELESILASEEKLMELIRTELLTLRAKYADPRRTRFIEASGDIAIHDLIAAEEQVITLSVNGYIKRTSHSEYQEQRRGGFGKRGMRTRNEDSVRELFLANTHSVLLVFTTHGQVFKVPVYQLPEAARDARGTPIVNLVQLEPEDNIAAVISIDDFDTELDLLFCSKKGLVKRTKLEEFKNLRAQGLRAYDCAEGDELLTVEKCRTEQHTLIITRQGMSIRFPGKGEDGALQVRHMGRVARGVKGITLEEGDEIVDLIVLEADADWRLLTITEGGYGKRTPIAKYRIQKRGGRGVIAIQTDEHRGLVAGTVPVREGDKIMIITNTGRVIKCSADSVREAGRITKGVRIMRIEENERVMSVARVVDPDDADGIEELVPEPLEEADEGEDLEGAAEDAEEAESGEE